MDETQGTDSQKTGAGLTLGEACEALGLPPSTFRQIIAEFNDLLEEPEEAGDVVVTISPANLERLRAISQWRNEGVPAGEIRQRLAGAGAEAAATAELANAEQLLLKQLESVRRALERSEERRVEDRDRMLTAMMRTQQEIQHLRYSIVANSSRRDRKKKGLFGRLFG